MNEVAGLADFCRKSLQGGQSPGGDRLLVSTCTLSTWVLGRGRFYHPSESQSLTQRRLFHSYNLKPWGPDMAVFMSTKHIHAEFHWFLTCSCYLKTLGEVCEITTKGGGGGGGNGKGKPQSVHSVHLLMLIVVVWGRGKRESSHQGCSFSGVCVLGFSTLNRSFLKAPWAGLCQVSALAKKGPERPPVS